jgi:hypothetical protein
MKSPYRNDPWSGGERRKGIDRRQQEKAVPKALDRRKGLEPRQPEVVELHLSQEEWNRIKSQFAAFA